MEKAVFGRLVQVLRKEHRDEQGKMWTQKLLSQKTKLSKRTIERIEKGSLQHLDSDIVVQLADALELTTMERKEFFLAAMGMNSSRLASFKSDHRQIFAGLEDILQVINLPAFVNDVFGDVVLVNLPLIKLLVVPEQWLSQPIDSPVQDNIMRTVFAPDSPFRSLLGEEWPTVAQLNMQFFRGISLRYRLHPHFQRLLAELLRFSTFKRHWEQAHLEENDLIADNILYEYDHPTFGHLAYMANISTSVTSKGELYSVIYIPMDQQTAHIFQGIVQEFGNHVIKGAAWPKDDHL